MSGAIEPLPPADDRQGRPNLLSKADAEQTLALNEMRLERCRSARIGELIEETCSAVRERTALAGGIRIAGVVGGLTHDSPGTLHEMGVVTATVFDGTGWAVVHWEEGDTFTHVLDENGEPRYIGVGAPTPNENKGWRLDAWRELLKPHESKRAPRLKRGDIAVIQLRDDFDLGSGFDEEVGADVLWCWGDSEGCSVLLPVRAGEDADWHPRFSRPSPKESLDLKALLNSQVGADLANGHPFVMRGADGTGLMPEGASVLVSGAPDAGKSMLAVCAAHDLLTQKPHGTVIWFDADGLGAANVARRLIGLGIPQSWIDEGRLIFESAPMESHDVWVERVSAMAHDLQPIAVVWDGLNAALASTGCGMDEGGVIAFRQKFVDPFRGSRPSCVVIITDHLAKSASHNDPYSHGAQGKLAQVDIHIRVVRSGSKLTPGTAASIGVKNLRDRTGLLEWQERRLSITPAAHEAPMTWGHEGAKPAAAPEHRFEGEIERIIEALDDHGPQNVTSLRTLVRGKSQRIAAALEEACRRGVVTTTKQGSVTTYSLPPRDETEEVE